MREAWRVNCWVAAFLLFGLLAWGQTEPIGVTVSPAAASVGDELHVQVDLPTFKAIASFSVSLPKEQRNLVVAGDPQKSGAGWTIPVRCLVPGEQQLGPLTIQATTADGQTREFTTTPFKVSIAEPTVEAAEPEDYTPPLLVPFDWTLRNMAIGAAVLVGLLIAVLLARWMWRHRPGLAPKIAPPPTPPLEEAVQALARLATMEVFHGAGAKAHYSMLSYLLRRYFERQLRFPALEMSEEALVEHLSGQSENMTDLHPLLIRASMAKFACWEASEAEASEEVATARVFLESEAERLRRLENAAAKIPQEGARAA